MKLFFRQVFPGFFNIFSGLIGIWGADFGKDEEGPDKEFQGIGKFFFLKKALSFCPVFCQEKIIVDIMRGKSYI